MTELEKLYSVFVDEAMESIAEIEDGLLQLEKNPEDRELINTVFRAAHTIKGSSGSIGLGDISRFTHAVEEVLDSVRQGRLDAGKECITVILSASDLIKEMVSSVASGSSFDFSKCESLM